MAEKISDAEMLERIMKGLHCSPEEAKEVLAYDKTLKDNNNGECKYDLTPEQHKIAQTYCRTGTRKVKEKPKTKGHTAYKFSTRPKKENATKAGIIAELVEFFGKNSQFSVENLEILNKERQISFQIGEQKYELTLVQKRKTNK